MHSVCSWFVSEVWPNLVANVVWGTPAFLTSHLLLRRHITRTAQTGQDKETSR